ncbi:MAG: hypothetical protein V3T70_09075, partial [Phycisphaerae bacterium]
IPVCIPCGYDLTGNVSGRCPECGTVVSIATRVAEAIDRLHVGDTEGALIPTSIAVAGTARSVYPNEGDDRALMAFVEDNLGLITRVALDSETTPGAIRLPYRHLGIEPDDDGLCTLEQILHHVVRCGLVQEEALPANIRFHDDGAIRFDDGVLLLPAALVQGLLAAVIVSPVNAAERIDRRSARRVRTVG